MFVVNHQTFLSHRNSCGMLIGAKFNSDFVNMIFWEQLKINKGTNDSFEYYPAWVQILIEYLECHFLGSSFPISGFQNLFFPVDRQRDTLEEEPFFHKKNRWKKLCLKGHIER